MVNIGTNGGHRILQNVDEVALSQSLGFKGTKMPLGCLISDTVLPNIPAKHEWAIQVTLILANLTIYRIGPVPEFD